jgi:hypothetical protein
MTLAQQKVAGILNSIVTDSDKWAKELVGYPTYYKLPVTKSTRV